MPELAIVKLDNLDTGQTFYFGPFLRPIAEAQVRAGNAKNYAGDRLNHTVLKLEQTALSLEVKSANRGRMTL